MAALQRFVDNAIPKTVNTPLDPPLEACSDIFTPAYRREPKQDAWRTGDARVTA